MSRITECFNNLKSQGRKALIPYVTAGDPDPKVTLPLMHALVESGADIIELGIPFSDPMADGPVIQLACERALLHGTRLTDVLDIVAEFRKTNQITPVVLMGYLNPIEVLGYAVFAEKAKAVGLDGVLTVDLPPEEAGEFNQLMKAADIDVIYLLSPTTEVERVKLICAAGSGYVYYVSVKGVTGSASLNVDEVAEKLQMIRQHTEMPVGVGFGIRDDISARAVSEVADGVIVGSVLVNKIAELAGDQDKIPDAVAAITASMRQAMDK